jgi:DNA-binding MarR family transcriptional regulator
MVKGDVARLWAHHYKVVASVIAEVAPDLRELGLEVKELFLLSELEAHPHPAALADALLVPRPTVTLYVKRLEASGLIARALDGTDLRRHKLSLTPEGRKALARGLALVTEAFGRRVGRLTGAQQAELKLLLEKLG